MSLGQFPNPWDPRIPKLHLTAPKLIFDQNQREGVLNICTRYVVAFAASNRKAIWSIPADACPICYRITQITGGQPLTVSPTSSPLDIGDIDDQDEITPFLKDEL